MGGKLVWFKLEDGVIESRLFVSEGEEGAGEREMEERWINYSHSLMWSTSCHVYPPSLVLKGQ